MGEPAAEPLRIEVVESIELQIEWSDGATTAMTSAQARSVCPCAGCRALPESERFPESYLDATIDAVALVGSYAVSFVFGPDGHSAGIYSFSDLYAY